MKDWNTRADSERQGWIGVEDRMPDRDTQVLWYPSTEEGLYDILYWDDPDFPALGSDWIFYTHWMPLPEPPEVKDD